jgi:hypothetical protein
VASSFDNHFCALSFCAGVTALADAIRSNRTLSVANVIGNKIGKEELSKLREIMHSKPNLMSLCGIPDDATEADLSYLSMDADDIAIILASELPDKRSLSTLDVSNSNISSVDQQAMLQSSCSAKGIALTFGNDSHRQTTAA